MGTSRFTPLLRFRSAPAIAALAAASLGIAPVRAAVLEIDDRPIDLAVSVGTGYSAVADSEGTSDLAFAQIGISSILWSRFEAALDLRIDFDPSAAGTADAVDSYLALLWVIGHLDMLPLTPFVGVGGGVAFPADLGPPIGTAGGCAGLALWFAATWRVTLRAAQRWNFDESASMATEIALTGEWYF